MEVIEDWHKLSSTMVRAVEDALSSSNIKNNKQ
jgi:hypothetical protein